MLTLILITSMWLTKMKNCGQTDCSQCVTPVETLFQLYIVRSVATGKMYVLNICTHQCSSALNHAIMSEVFFFKVLLQVWNC